MGRLRCSRSLHFVRPLPPACFFFCCGCLADTRGGHSYRYFQNFSARDFIGRSLIILVVLLLLRTRGKKESMKETGLKWLTGMQMQVPNPIQPVVSYDIHGTDTACAALEKRFFSSATWQEKVL